MAETARIRRRIERRESVTFWGQLYTITPRLISRVFGDGKLLLGITPLATRPNYFVVRVDSATKDPCDPCPTDKNPHAISLLDEIIIASKDEYGYFGDDEYRDKSGDEKRRFPVTDWGIGCTWGTAIPEAQWFPPKRKQARP